MKDKTILISFVFFVFVIFLLNNFNISGQVYDVSNRYCSDSDDGKKPFTAGYVDSDIGTFYDKCQDNLNQVREYYCEKDSRFLEMGNYKPRSRVVNCGQGAVCVRNLDDADACVQR